MFSNHGPARLDLTATKGMDWSWGFTVTQGGAAFNLTGATITAVVKTAEDSSGSSVVSLTGTVVSGSGGTFTVGKAASGTGVTAGRYFWSCYTTSSGGTKTPLMAGTFTVDDSMEA